MAGLAPYTNQFGVLVGSPPVSAWETYGFGAEPLFFAPSQPEAPKPTVAEAPPAPINMPGQSLDTRGGSTGGGRDNGRQQGGGAPVDSTSRSPQMRLEDAVKAGRVDASAYARNPAYRAAVNDALDFGNTGLENIGNALASVFGVRESLPPREQATSWSQPNANWGFDPAGLAGSVLGSAVGMPIGAGLLADTLSGVAGRPLSINLGPAVMGRPSEPNFANFAAAVTPTASLQPALASGIGFGLAPARPAAAMVPAVSPTGPTAKAIAQAATGGQGGGSGGGGSAGSNRAGSVSGNSGGSGNRGGGGGAGSGAVSAAGSNRAGAGGPTGNVGPGGRLGHI